MTRTELEKHLGRIQLHSIIVGGLVGVSMFSLAAWVSMDMSDPGWILFLMLQAVLSTISTAGVKNGYYSWRVTKLSSKYLGRPDD